MGDGLIEREHEAERLTRLVERVAVGDHDAVMVEGAPGVGKSTLTRAAMAAATARGMVVLSAVGSPLEADTPFAVVRQLFGPVTADPTAQPALFAGAAALAAPVVADLPGPGGDLHAVLHGLHWLTVHLAKDRPVVVVVDDVQWSDDPSSRFLGYLTRRLDGIAVGVLLAARTGEPAAADRLLDEIRGTGTIDRVRVSELSQSGSLRKVADLTGGRAGPGFAQACHAVTGGNPFLLEELVNTCLVDGVPLDDTGAGHVARVVPRQVASSVLLRLARMSPAAVDVARAVAVLGSSATVARAAALAGLPVDVAATEVETLTTAQVLAGDSPLRFRHPLVRSAVYDDLPGAARAVRHGAAARLLSAEHAADDAVAGQLLLAEPGGDLVARDVLHRVGRQASEQGAFDAAVLLLRRALEEAPAAPSPALLRDLGLAEATRDSAAASAHLEAAIELAGDAAERAGIASALAEVLALAGEVSRAHSLLDQQLSQDGLPADLSIRLTAQWGQTAVWSGRPPSEVHTRVAAAAEEAGPDLPSYASAAAVAALTATDPEDRRRWAAAAAAAADSLPASGTVTSLMPPLVERLCLNGDVAAAATVAEDVTRAARASGSMLSSAIALFCTALPALHAGRLPDAEAAAASGLELAREGGWKIGVSMCGAVLARALADRGRLDEAEAVLDQLPTVMTLDTGEVSMARARVKVAKRQFDDALRLVDEVDALAGPLGMVSHLVPKIHALAGLGRVDEAQTLASHVLEVVRARGVELGIADALLASAAASPADVARWQVAVDELSPRPFRLQTARALAGLGAALRRAREARRGREMLEQALDLAHRCAAAVLEEEIRAELAAAGARPRRAAVTGVAALTAAELRVCRLATELSNDQVAQALFVSVKTVETQLSAAYRKLGIRGRSDLAAALSEREPT